jgi:catalase
VFFIQDAILFPDLIHAVKPRPDSEIPQAATAHDSAWDFFSQQPSTMHTLFWAMSGHGIVRSYRHMDGFGVHTFRFVTDEGESRFVKFHWKTLQGKASLLWEEAQAASGKNADFHRQDLFDSIANGYYPEWEASHCQWDGALLTLTLCSVRCPNRGRRSSRNLRFRHP